MRFLFKFAGLCAVLTTSLYVQATEYPLTVTDMAGRQVTINHEPKHIVLQDGRDLMALAVLDKENPFKRVVAWNNLLKKNDFGLWQKLANQWPESKNILDMKFSDSGSVSIEDVLSKKPDIVIAQLRAKSSFEQDGVLRRMQKAQVPVLFVDTGVHPIKNTVNSMALLGKVLNRESQAKAYDDYYHEKLDNIQNTVKQHTQPRPTVFFESHAGAHGPNDCCFTHSTFGWGALVKAAGGDNLALSLLKGPSGVVSLEKVLALQPDVYFMSGSQWTSSKSIGIPFGYDVPDVKIQAAFKKLISRPGFSELNAVKHHQVYGVYHQFYNHSFNIIGIEAIAKDLYPRLFADFHPNKDYQALLKRFTDIDPNGLTISEKAL